MKRLILGVAMLALTGTLCAPQAWAKEAVKNGGNQGAVALSIDLQIERMVKEGAPAKVILWKYVDAGLDVSDVVRMLHKAGANDGAVVKAAITEGFSAKQVVKAAISSGADLKTVVAAAHNAGAKDKDITQGAKDAGVKPELAASTLAEVKGEGAPQTFAFTPTGPAPERPGIPAPGVGGAPPSTKVSSPII
ncbi:MAG: hypothetical protein HZB85_03730 [Deltaproteobacteria bacterium]|nr:hypothetical protein [Deltaproteobacteria bacterium]